MIGPAKKDCVLYRVVVVCAHSRELIRRTDGRLQVLHVSIPFGHRPAQALCAAMKNLFQIEALMVDLLSEEDALEPCVLMETLIGSHSIGNGSGLTSNLCCADLSDSEMQRLTALLNDENACSVSSIGWTERARNWIAESAGYGVERIKSIQQLNAGKGFALLSFITDDERRFWLKATGSPNQKEFAITRLLAERAPDALPLLLDTRSAWNAWIMEDAGQSLCSDPRQTTALRATRCFVSLQARLVGSADSLFEAGAIDLRVEHLMFSIERVVDYLLYSMPRQTSTNSMPLTSSRVKELGAILHSACEELAALNLPDTVLHNDLHCDNFLVNSDRCCVTDWCVTGVGMPFLCCDDLSRATNHPVDSTQACYAEMWGGKTTQTGLRLGSLLSPYAKILAHGRWIGDHARQPAWFETYARTMARQLDRAAQNAAESGGFQ